MTVWDQYEIQTHPEPVCRSCNSLTKMQSATDAQLIGPWVGGTGGDTQEGVGVFIAPGLGQKGGGCVG